MRAAVLLASAIPAPALAQAYQCTLPGRAEALPEPEAKAAARRGPIASYTLAISWSPEYCRARRDARSMQCSGANGRFGFVLHGLWPEAAQGPPPQWCSPTPGPSPELVRRNLCMTPAPRLLQHEWAKHGSCMVRTPAAYYRVSAILWHSLRWPDGDRLSRRKGLTVGALRRAFLSLNPDWKADQVAVDLSPAGWLSELRLCYGRDFLPRTCRRGRMGARDDAPLKIWRGL